MTQDETFRLETLIAHMTPRLRPICAEWPEETFNAMVRRLAEITLKYEGNATGGQYDRRSTDRLVAELKGALEHSAATKLVAEMKEVLAKSDAARQPSTKLTRQPNGE